MGRPGLTWGEKAASAASAGPSATQPSIDGAGALTGASRTKGTSHSAAPREAPEAGGLASARTVRTPASGRRGPELLPGPDYFLGSEVLGVSPGAPGHEILQIRPQTSGLEGAGGRIPTRRGPVEVEWQAEEERFALRVELAEPGETHLFAPRLGQRYPTVSLNGELVWRNEKVHPNPFVQEIISAARHVVLVVRGRGPYEVLVTP